MPCTESPKKLHYVNGIFIYITIGKYEYYSVLREYPKVCVNFQTDVRLTSLEVYCMARNVYCIIKLAKNTRAGSHEIGPAQSN